MENQIGPKGLGGWLILVGLGVVITPFRLLAIYVPLYLGIFKNGTWEALTTAGSESYHALWGPLLVGEILCNFGVIAVSIYMMYLYFAKHYLFPKFYIGLIIFSLVFIPLDAWLVSIILPNQPMFDPSTLKELARTLIAGFIWVPYMLVSKRVKATFVEKLPTIEAQPIGDNIG